MIAPKHAGPGAFPSYRTYSAAKSNRLTTGWGTLQTSADAELASSLRTMRARSREDQRDKSFAKRARTVVQNNIIGSGIGLQAQVKSTRGELNKRVNGAIESSFETWCLPENCHTGGSLHFHDMERLAVGEVFEGGEILVREHRRRFGASSVPYALEIIEPERLLDEHQPATLAATGRVRMGVELDEFQRPIAYHIRRLHPGDVTFAQGDIDYVERVPAEDIIHLRLVDRWPQTRSAPWMHAAMRTLEDTDGYSYSEIVRARAEANTVGALKTTRPYGNDVKDAQGNVTERQVSSEPGTYETLYDEEELQFPPRTAPNSAADPFLRYMLRSISAGTGVSYESLSRDYSQSNYSSSRLALLDDRDLWRVYQMWFIRAFRMRVHRNWMNAAVLARAIDGISVEAFYTDPQRYLAVRFKPRGWSWVDPTKEVEAYKEAIKAGLTTRTDVISQTANGRDREDIDEERAQELKEAEEQGLAFDTDPEAYAPQPAAPAPPDNSEDIKKIAEKQEQAEKDNADRFGRIIAEQRKHETEIVKAVNARPVSFNFSPTTNVAAPAVSVPVDARSTVTVPERDVTIENRVDVQPAAAPVVTVPIENRVDVQPAAAPQVTVPIENRVDVAPAAAPVVTVPIENRVDVQPAAAPVVAVPIENRVDGQPAQGGKKYGGTK